MKKLMLKNATLELLTETKVRFIGELKGYTQRLSYTITMEEVYEGLKQLDKNSTYNIWSENGFLRFIKKS